MCIKKNFLVEYIKSICVCWASQVGILVKNPPANAGDLRDEGSIPGLGRCSGGGHGHSLHYSCLENLMDRGAWLVTALRVTALAITEAT